MSNPLYEQLKTKVEASSLTHDRFDANHLDWHEDLLEAERLRSLAIARIFANLFSKGLASLSTFGGALERARSANALSKMDGNRLAKFGLDRTDLPAFVAGYVTNFQTATDISDTRQNIRKAA